jgi:hypothetical protein
MVPRSLAMLFLLPCVLTASACANNLAFSPGAQSSGARIGIPAFPGTDPGRSREFFQEQADGVLMTFAQQFLAQRTLLFSASASGEVQIRNGGSGGRADFPINPPLLLMFSCPAPALPSL